MIKGNAKYILALIVLSYIFLFLGNGLLELTNPDEVFYVQTAKEMVQQKTWMTPYLFGVPQFEKPIFLYWMLRIGFNIFGVNSNFGARFFPALFALIGVLAVYYLGSTTFKNAKKAFICALVLASGGLYIGLARTVFTDMIFSVFVLLAMVAFYAGYCHKEKRTLGVLGFYVFMGLGVLAKGPLGFLIPFGAVASFLIIKRDLKFLLSKYSFLGLLLFIGISFPWYMLMIQKYGRTFTYEFFYNDHYRRLIEAEHPLADTWYFYPGSMFGCMFPWTLFLLVAAYYYVKRFIKKQASVLDIFLSCWIGVTFIIFQLAHSKLTSYIVPLFPALAIMGGEFIYSIITAENKNRIFFVLSLIMCALVGLVSIGLLATQGLYVEYMPSKVFIYSFFACLLVFGGALLVFTLSYKFFKAIILISFFVPLLVLSAFSVHHYIDPYVSSKAACDYLVKNYKIESPIICSKFYVRGVRFYTGKEVVVAFDKGFFSPHPLEYVNSDDEMRAYLLKHQSSYCVFKRSSVDDMKRVLSMDKIFTATQLKKIGNTYLLKIELAK